MRPSHSARPQLRTLKVRLLCGLVLWVTTAYCAPRRSKKTDATEQLVGLYPELAALGIGKGCSPALQYKVARMVALSPSIEAARKELQREGIVLNKKAVRRIAEQLGQQLLELRRRELFAWRDGWLLPGNEFAGRRVAVPLDGGRVRLRENKKRKKGTRAKFDTPWREPKALIIFEFNKQGKMIKKERQPLIDGTLLGPDHLDTGWSLFTERFAQGLLPFAYDLRHIGLFLHHFERLMAHWRRILGGRLLSLSYAELVTEPRACVARMLAHCGLPWALSLFCGQRSILVLNILAL